MKPTKRQRKGNPHVTIRRYERLRQRELEYEESFVEHMESVWRGNTTWDEIRKSTAARKRERRATKAAENAKKTAEGRVMWRHLTERWNDVYHDLRRLLK